MEENQRTLSEEKMLSAMRFVRQYIKANGGDPYDIDWDEKPKYLPPEVEQAWDDYCSFWDKAVEGNYVP